MRVCLVLYLCWVGLGVDVVVVLGVGCRVFLSVEVVGLLYCRVVLDCLVKLLNLACLLPFLFGFLFFWVGKFNSGDLESSFVVRERVEIWLYLLVRCLCALIRVK
jgi:hypothetical protein